MAGTFPQFDETWEVWRTGNTGGWDDSPFVFIGYLRGHLEPVNGDEEFLNKQDFQNVTHFGITYISNEGTIKSKDYIVTPRGEQFIAVGEPEVWRYLIPHIAVKLQVSQEPIDFPPVPTT